MSALNIWEFVAGLGIFLFGMTQVEHALNKFAGKRLGVFLRDQTNNPIKSIFGGTFATAFLQSSSVVSLMVLAFVGAGIIEMRNALGIIFGANLGTTLTGWIVATIGFKLDIEAFALPLIGIGSLGILIVAKKTARSHLLLSIFGIGIILLGLSYMKGSLESLSSQFDIATLSGYPPIIYLFVGLLFTAVIQSSSATMMIALSALNADVIELSPAVALIIGADLGTTSTVLLGGLKGTAGKKQVALAHFLFNLVTAVLAFLMLGPLLAFLINVIGMKDPLYTLVAFHSSFNLLGIVLFLPFIKPFANYLEKRFVVTPTRAARFISAVPARVSEAAMTAMEKETRSLVAQVFALNRRCLKMDIAALITTADSNLDSAFDQHAKFDEQYGTIKTLEGEMLEYSVSVQKHLQTPDSITRLNDLLSSIRDAVVSAKSLKDIRHNLVNFRHTASQPMQNYNQFLIGFMEPFYRQLKRLWDEENHALLLEQFSKLIVDNNQFHDDFIKRIYADAKLDIVDERVLSTLLNVNRELFTSNQNLLNALQHLLLDPQEHEHLGNLHLNR